MGEVTKISWCDHSFNPWVGCTKVSAACDRCYAESWAKRTGNPELWQGERRRTSEANWRLPYRWADAAKAGDMRRRVFCASLADVFDNQVPDQWRLDLFDMIARTGRYLDWLLLTKRPQNIRKMLPRLVWQSIWLGTTAEDQEQYQLRYVKHLSKISNVPLRFISYEPALGPLRILPRADESWSPPDWVIFGGESGGENVVRKPEPNWARSVRDECAGAGIAYFHKQWGTYGANPLVVEQGYSIGAARDKDPDAKGGVLLDRQVIQQFPTPQAR